MNNCVGYLNYRYFVLFLLYMFIGCAYAVLVSAPQFIAMAKSTGVSRRFLRVVGDASRKVDVLVSTYHSAVDPSTVIRFPTNVYSSLSARDRDVNNLALMSIRMPTNVGKRRYDGRNATHRHEALPRCC